MKVTPEEIDEILQQMLDSVPPAQRVAGLVPEDRLTDLAPEQQILALSNDVLRSLPSDYLRTLPADIQETIGRRFAAKATP